MPERYRKFKRTWGTYYAYDNYTGNSVSLKTRDRAEAVQKVNAMNEAERQPSISLGLARVYLNATDPKLATRTWQEVMEHIVERKTDETRRRWAVAIKDKNLDRIRNLKVAETRPEHFDRALADGKVSTNVYLRRIHNHALGMDWLLRPVIPRLHGRARFLRPSGRSLSKSTGESSRPKLLRHDATKDRGTHYQRISRAQALSLPPQASD